MASITQIDYKNLESDYYQINRTKKILYWDGIQWMKPAKDFNKKFGSYVEHLPEQPKNIKNITPVWETEFKDLYRP